VYILVSYLFLRELHRPAINHNSEFRIILFYSQSSYVLRVQKCNIYATYSNAIEHKLVFCNKNIIPNPIFDSSKHRPGISSVLGNLQIAPVFFPM
jgi:hypothetical protein